MSKPFSSHPFPQWLTIEFSRSGRMEAKGCAKPTVWKDARRHFYWALRAKIARSAALAQLAAASPGTTYEYRARLLNNLANLEADSDPRQVSSALESLDINHAVSELRADYLIRQMLELTQDDRKVALQGFSRLADGLSEEERNDLIAVLQRGPRSPGTSHSNSIFRT